MSDLPTRILLVAIAMGVWANVLFLVEVHNHTGKARAILDNIDWNLADTGNRLKRIELSVIELSVIQGRKP
jgi:hypothetical protein